MKKKLKMIDLFAGIGGFHTAAANTDLIETVFASDIDPNTSKVYELNYGLNSLCDITKVKEEEIPKHDIIAGGFPCQAFSIAGARKGFDDTRGTLFFDVARIIKHHKPMVVFLENVKGLMSHDGGNTFKVILQQLDELGYDVFHQILNTYKHGNIPQNRERIYIVGFLKKLKIKTFEFPKEIPLKNKFLNFIPRNKKVPEKYYYTNRFQIYESIKNDITSKETAYQWRRVYVRANKSNVCPTLTANMGTGGHNVPLIVDDFGIRKLTPRECLSLQGFPKDFKIPEGMADSKIYKQAGNSVSVPVIQRIFEEILNKINEK